MFNIAIALEYTKKKKKNEHRTFLCTYIENMNDKFEANEYSSFKM